jgi:sulfate adenylyltransferase
MTNAKGVCIWFTGRSGAGKSTITNQLIPRLEACGRTITLLDVVPLLAKQWCEKTSEGKLLRKGFVASEVVRHGGIAICVTVSARRETREAVRQMVGPDNFIEVYVDVPPEVAAARKAKRPKKQPLIKRVRALLRRILNAVRPRESVTYEEPTSADLTFDATSQPPEETAEAIFQLLIERGFLTLADGNKIGKLQIKTAGSEQVARGLMS